MAWIPLYQTVWDNRKTMLLADLLGISETYAAAHMARLWTWALDNAQDGEIGHLTPRVIARAADWPGDPEQFVEAMVTSGYVDRDGESLRIHDWMDYAGRLMEQRQLNNERSKRKRDLYDDPVLTAEVKRRDGDLCRYCGRRVNWRDRKSAAGGTYDHVDPEGPNTLENVVVSCRGCNSRKGRRRPKEAGMTLLPPGTSAENLPESTRNLPGTNSDSANSTVPNTTSPDDDDHAPARDESEAPDPRTECLALIARVRPDWILSGERYREFLEYEDQLPWPVIRTAVDKTLAAGARDLKYCLRILETYVEQRVQTVADVEALDAEFERRKQQRARDAPARERGGRQPPRSSNVILRREPKDASYYEDVFKTYD